MEQRQFIKYPEISYLEGEREIEGKDLYLFEKLDGSNCQVSKINWRLFPGRRSGFIDGKIWENLYGIKSWMGDFKRWAMSNKSLLSLPEDVVLFGEWLHKKLGVLEGMPIDYPESAYNKFYFIDLAKIDNKGNLKEMIPYDYGVSLIEDSGIQGIEVLPYQKVNGITGRDLEYLLRGHIPHQLAIGIPEGVVIKNYQSENFFARKVVSAPYEERAKKEEDSRKRYCTVPRIRKRYLELWDTIGPVISPELLTNSVLEDIAKEEKIKADIPYTFNKVVEFLKRVN